MYQQNQVQNRPTAAYILSLIGGIIGLLVSIAFIVLGALAFSAVNSIDYYGYYNTGFGLGWTFLLGLGFWSLITSILIITFASKLKTNPIEHTKWGILIVIFSIIGVGGLFGLIGGILALVYKPIPEGAPQYDASQPQYYAPPPQQPAYAPSQPAWNQQQATRVCPQCGRIVQANERFCPNCGKQLY